MIFSKILCQAGHIKKECKQAVKIGYILLTLPSRLKNHGLIYVFQYY